MYRTSCDPFSDCWEMFRSFMNCAPWGGRRFYTRQERIEQLEKLRARLQKEIAGIDELIQDLKRSQS